MSPIKNFYYCFGCSASGNGIRFLMDYHRLSFVEACQQLAQRLGITIETQERSPQEQQQQAAQKAQIKRDLHILQLSQEFFSQQLMAMSDHHPVKRYLKKRNITQWSIDTFQLGFAPSSWDSLKKHIVSQGFSEDNGLESGLLIDGQNSSSYDRFRNRIMFPITDKHNAVIGFGGRVLGEEQPKYLNSPETPTFQKRTALFGLPQVLSQKGQIQKILLVEGYMDVIRMHQVGLRYALAALGTATSIDHARLLMRLTDQIIICFDSDVAGNKAAWRFFETCLPLVTGEKDIRFLFLPQGSDPDSFIQEQGKDAFVVEETNAMPLMAYFFQELEKNLNTNMLDDRAQLLHRAMPFLPKIQDGLFKDLVIQKLSELSQLDKDVIQQRLTHSKQAQKESTFNNAPQQDNYNTDRSFNSQPNNQQSLPNTNRWPQKSQSKGRYIKGKWTPFQIEKLPTQRSLIDSMLRLLLQNPKLAENTALNFETTPNIQGYELFAEVHNHLLNEKDSNLAYLIGLWHDQPQGQYISRLLAEEFLVPEDEAASEFADGIRQLDKIALNQALEQATQERPLDHAKLQRLIQIKRQKPSN